MTTKKYVAGNWLRGSFEGEFSSIDEAWSYLSNRFLLSFPSKSRRQIYMKVKEKNQYGFEDWILCKAGFTEINELSKEDVLSRCKASYARI